MLVNRISKAFVCIVIIPTLIAGLYIGIFSVDRYVSESQLVVRQTKDEGSQAPGLAVLLGATNTASREETLYVKEHILSNQTLDKLQKRLDWISHYSRETMDPLFWISKSSPQEDRLEYYRKMTKAEYSEQTGLLTVSVQAFDPKFAADVVNVLLQDSEFFVNELSQKVARSQVFFAETELKRSRLHLDEINEKLISFQNQNRIFDAQSTAASQSNLISELELELAKQQIVLTKTLASVGRGGPQYKAQSEKVAAINEQISKEKSRLVSNRGDSNLNRLTAEFRALKIDQALAEDGYKYSMTALERARVDSIKQIRSLVTIVSPTTAEIATYPKRLYNFLSILVLLLLIFGVVRFVAAAIDDHRD